MSVDGVCSSEVQSIAVVRVSSAASAQEEHPMEAGVRRRVVEGATGVQSIAFSTEAGGCKSIAL